MLPQDNLELSFVVGAFLLQIVLIIHVALRKWRFDLVVRFGWIVCALGVPAALLSLRLLLGGKTWPPVAHLDPHPRSGRCSP
jgi:hypothetical protein